MDAKEEIMNKIEEKERQLARAERESFAWNKEKYKGSSNAKMSKIYMESIKKEISTLHQLLSEIESEST